MTAKRKPGPDAAHASLLVPEKLATLVHYLRREKVILDSDLAQLYGVLTKALNQAVQRNLGRFPSDFMFQLTENEEANLRSQIVTSKNAGSSLRSQIVTLKAWAAPQVPPLRLYRARRGHAFQRVAVGTCRGGEHRHHAHVRPAPAADGFQCPPRQQNRSPRRKIRRPRPAVPTRFRGHQTTHRRSHSTHKRTRLSHHSIRDFRQKEETLTLPSSNQKAKFINHQSSIYPSSLPLITVHSALLPLPQISKLKSQIPNLFSRSSHGLPPRITSPLEEARRYSQCLLLGSQPVACRRHRHKLTHEC